MRIGRTLPPAAAPLTLREIWHGVRAVFAGEKATARFEAELREYYQVPCAFLLSSGKAALTVILLALKELAPERDEVLIPAYTCYSVPAAVVKAGLKVRVCDIDPGSLDFDWAKIDEAFAGRRVLCAVSTHLFGLPADVERLKGIASLHGALVVEDAAQAMGGEVAGKKVGTMGDVALFSLGRGKALSTVSGGIILTSTGRVGDAVARVVGGLPREGWRDFLVTLCYAIALTFLVRPGLYWFPRSLPFLKLGETVYDPEFTLKRLGSFQAGLACGWQEKLNWLRETRLGHAMYLEQAGVKGPVALNGTVPNLIRFPVLVEGAKRKRRLLEDSEEKGLGIAAVYPEALTGVAALQGALLGGPAPQAEQVAQQLLSLPVHPYVTNRDLQRVAELFGEADEDGN